MTTAQRTGERLERAAMNLFEQRGYDAVSVGEVAAAAGVTEMTFFRNFAGKEAVLLDDPCDPAIAEEVGAQPRHLPPIVRVSAGIAAPGVICRSLTPSTPAAASASQSAAPPSAWECGATTRRPSV